MRSNLFRGVKNIMTPKKYKIIGIQNVKPKNGDKYYKILHCLAVDSDSDGNIFVATLFVPSDSSYKIKDYVNLLYFGGRYNIINI